MTQKLHGGVAAASNQEHQNQRHPTGTTDSIGQEEGSSPSLIGQEDGAHQQQIEQQDPGTRPPDAEPQGRAGQGSPLDVVRGDPGNLGK